MGYQLFAIAIGGAAGAVSRFLISHWVGENWGTSFPYATLSVNLIGSALIGVAFVLLLNASEPAFLRGLVITGFLGALTTFSTFSLDILLLIESGAVLKAGTYLIANVVGCVLAAGTAFHLTKWAL